MTTLADLWQGIAALALPAALWITVALLLERFVAWRWAPEWRAALWWLVAARLVVPATWTASWGWWGGGSTGGTMPGALPAGADAAAAAVPWVAVVWALGVVVVAAILVTRTRRHARSVQRRARPAAPARQTQARALAARFGSRRAPPIVEDPQATSPYVFGLWRPTIVLPSSGLTPADVEQALLHELGHLRRRDLWSQAFLSAVAALHWFHPLAWVARSRAHATREMCCDALVAAHQPGGARAYRRALLRFATRSVRGAGTLAMGHTHSGALARVDALERFRHDRHGRRRWIGACALLVLGVVLLPHAAAAPATNPVTSTRSEVADAERRLHDLLTSTEDTGGLQLRYATWALADAEFRAAAAVRTSPTSLNPRNGP